MAFRNWRQELEDARPPGPSPWPLVGRVAGAIGLVAGAVCGALWGWPGYLRPQPWKRPGPPPSTIMLVFSNDVQGYLEPCGCTEQRWGGVARVRGYLGGLAEPASRLAFDVGNMTAGPALWQQAALRTYLRALGKMGYTAANLGHGELALRAEDIVALAKGSPVPLVSANAIHDRTEQPLVATHHSVLIDNLRVTVVGVVQVAPQDRLGAGVAVSDASEALGRLLPSLRAETDLLVLLAACEEPTMRDIARRHPEIDVVLGGRVQQATPQIQQVATRWLAWHCNKGQMLGRVDVRVRPDGRPESASSAMILLDNDVPEDPSLLDLVEQYNGELSQLNRQGGLAALGVAVAPPPGRDNTYVGSQVCQQCHPTSHAIWREKDKHSQAYASLAKRNRQSNPDCIRCHVLELGAADGYLGITLTPQYVDVHCESCHGRSSQHVAARKAKMDKTVGSHPKLSPTSCETCHDCVHSPKFSYQTYWEKIKHAKEPDQDKY